MRLLLPFVLICTILGWMQGCEGLVESKIVSPASTGTGIVNPGGLGYGNHIVGWKSDVVMNCESAGKCGLSVFLAGSGGTPGGYTKFLTAAAEAGFHSIGLSYANPTAVGVLCGGTSYARGDCQLSARTEVATGANVSTVIEVDAANSIANRLLRLILYMHLQNQTLGWDAYVKTSMDVANETKPEDAGNVLYWNRITFSGHSQGGGTSQIVAGLFPLRRALLFSNAVLINSTSYNQLAKTGSSQYRTFFNLQDSLSDMVPEAEANVLQTATLSAIVDVDSALPGSALRLRTNVTVSNVHGCTVVDSETPLDGTGEPVFLQVWNAMLGSPDSGSFSSTTSTVATQISSTSSGSPSSPSTSSSNSISAPFWI